MRIKATTKGVRFRKTTTLRLCPEFPKALWIQFHRRKVITVPAVVGRGMIDRGLAIEDRTVSAPTKTLAQPKAGAIETQKSPIVPEPVEATTALGKGKSKTGKE